MLKDVQEMKNSAMDTSLFSPVYSVDSAPPSLSPALSVEDAYPIERVQEELEEEEDKASLEGRLCQDASRGSELTPLSTRIQLDIPHILDPPTPDSPQGKALGFWG